ncbi:MAG TPA: protoglobin domain-containing protein [Pirellulales bacterium]|jgi:signal transduction histidine kinase|nr:protoglobin domain-containing protein [Pirellulales bacterium]
MPITQIHALYQELQEYVAWTSEDAERVRRAGPLLESCFPALIDDFYDEIDRHPQARKVITGGRPQIERLKGSLIEWLRGLVSGKYDAAYVARRWKVGLRHVEIGLDQVFTNVALSRLRRGVLRALEQAWRGDPAELTATRESFNILLDLDLAIIEDAYQTEFHRRQQRTDRLAAIGQVAGGIAHELRNPLNVVKTSVYYLLHALRPTPEKTQQHLERIERQVVLADSVIGALSDFARLPMPEMQPVALEACLREVLELTALPTAIHVEIDCPAGLPGVLGDARQLKIVFGNLIRNARDAMPDGGVLRIGALQAGDDIEVNIADTGVGIKHEDLERILEPLYSTKARGIGLGLALTRSIVERHAGALRVASEWGQGSTFTVRLAAAPQEESKT